MELNTFKKKLTPMPKKAALPFPRTCKICNTPKDEKEFRGTSKVCNPCDNARKNESQRKKRAERWGFLGLDMSTKF